jgi:uncharacterized protein
MNNLSLLRCLVICILLPFLSFSQSPTEKSLLWKISGNGLSKPSFLYGTIHVICPDELNLSEKTKLSFAETEQLYLELDLDDPTMAVNMQKSMQNTTHLKNLLSSKDYRNISNFFDDRVGYSIDMLGMIKPFYLLSFTYSPMIGCKEPTSLEMSFLSMAKQQEKEVFGLETLKDQMSIFDGISSRKQAKMLKNYVKNFDKMQDAFQKMLQEYKNQDLVALMKASAATNPKSNKYEHLLLDNRNQKWVAEIPNIIAKKPTFIAVGAAHLAGEKGVISLLRQKGFTLTPAN